MLQQNLCTGQTCLLPKYGISHFNFPKAIRIIITAVLAFAVAALLKLFLSNVLGL